MAENARRLSVLIPTKNVGRTLRRCLESVADVADEIVVLDSYSEDDTLDICAEFDTRVIQAKFRGFGELRKRLIDEAEHEWIFFIDADEEVSDELADDIERVLRNGRDGLYRVSRKNKMFGSWMKDIGGDPLRLGPKDAFAVPDDFVHEVVEPASGYEVVDCLGVLRHYTYESISEFFQKFDQYTSLEALETVSEGSSPALWRYIAKGVATAGRHLVLERGILDGYAAILFASFSFQYQLVTYGKVRELEAFRREHPDDWEQLWFETRCSR